MTSWKLETLLYPIWESHKVCALKLTDLFFGTCTALQCSTDLQRDMVESGHLATWAFTLCGKRGTCDGHRLILRGRCGTWRHRPSLSVSGVALEDRTLTLRGRCGTYGIQLALVTRLVQAGAASFFVAGVALGDIDLHFVCQADTWRHGPSLCVASVALFILVAGVALGDIDLHFLCEAWHLATWTFTWRGRCGSAGSCDALGPGGRRWRHRPSFCDLATWTFTLCGRRGTCGTQLALVTGLVLPGAASFCVAGVALGDIDLHFVWQAWHLATWTFTLCGRRGSYGSQLALVTRLVVAGTTSFCVAGVALGDMDFHFVWQHLATWTFTLCDKSGTYGTQLALVTTWSWRAPPHSA
eukprot:s250_g27.t1